MTTIRIQMLRGRIVTALMISEKQEKNNLDEAKVILQIVHI